MKSLKTVLIIDSFSPSVRTAYAENKYLLICIYETCSGKKVLNLSLRYHINVIPLKSTLSTNLLNRENVEMSFDARTIQR